MVVTKDVNLPEYASLNVPEVELSTASLMTAAPFLGKECEGVNNEFMLCRFESRDPRVCLDLGKQVTNCTLGFFKKVKSKCQHEFSQYVNCLDKSSGNYAYSPCRKTQAVFDKCMEDNLQLSRPDFGYFCRARVHESKLAPPPPPDPCPCQPKVPDPTPSLPDCKPRPPPRFGGRYYWMTD